MNTETNTARPTFSRRKSMKAEVGKLVVTTAEESATVVKFGLRTASNLVELAYLETIKLPLDSKVDQINELVEDGVMTREEADTAIKALGAKHTAKLIGDL